MHKYWTCRHGLVHTVESQNKIQRHGYRMWPKEMGLAEKQHLECQNAV